MAIHIHNYKRLGQLDHKRWQPTTRLGNSEPGGPKGPGGTEKEVEGYGETA
jgi:hypothetical protein